MNTISKRKLFAENLEDNEWCECNVELRKNQKNELALSICGSYGYITTEEQAEEQALEYYASYFEDDAQALVNAGTVDPEEAARKAIDDDGWESAVDAHKREDDRVYITSGCGQVRENIAQWFPEVKPFFKWHLNDMQAGCLHQQALKWGHGKTIAITRDEATPAQLGVFQLEAQGRASKRREDFVKRYIQEMRESKSIGQRTVGEALAHHPTVEEWNILSELIDSSPRGSTKLPKKYNTARKIDLWSILMVHLGELAKHAHPIQEFDAELFKDSIGAPCPECGYRYGTAWLTLPLPDDVVKWAETVGDPD